MPKRQSSIDLIRCVGLLFVVGVHSFLKNGYYSQLQTSLILLPANSFRWLFFSCNGIFLMLTGYLKTEKPFGLKYYKSLLPILLSYVLVCLLSFPVRHFLLDEPKSLAEWFSVFINFGNYAWYLEMYIGLLLVSPMINLAMDSLKTPRLQAALVGVLAVLSALPSMTLASLMPDYWTSLYPLTYYAIGAWIRRNQPKIHSAIGLTVTALTAIGLGLTTLLSTDKYMDTGFTQGYGGFWITLMTTGLFLGLYRLNITGLPARVLAWGANGCFEGYILSRLLDVWLYAEFPQWHRPEWYPMLFICVTVPIYLFALTSGNLVHWLTGRLMGLFRRKSTQNVS